MFGATSAVAIAASRKGISKHLPGLLTTTGRYSSRLHFETREKLTTRSECPRSQRTLAHNNLYHILITLKGKEYSIWENITNKYRLVCVMTLLHYPGQQPITSLSSFDNMNSEWTNVPFTLCSSAFCSLSPSLKHRTN